MKKATVVTLFFFVFMVAVGIPRAHATAWEGTAGRIAFRAFAPSVIKALGSGNALVVGCVISAGVGYVIYKSGAVTALKTWWDGNPGSVPDASHYPISASNYYSPTNGKWAYVFAGCSPGPACRFYNANGTLGYQGCYSNITAQMAQEINSWLAITAPVPPGVPTDYVQQLTIDQPSFPSNSVYATPRAAAALIGAAAIVSAATMTDSEAQSFINGSGASAVASDGTQAANPNAPSPTDNTVTAGDSASIGLLQTIAAHTSNLGNIKTSVDSVKTSTDCVASGMGSMVSAVNTQTGKLDNIAMIETANAGRLDNIVANTAGQAAKLDNIATGVSTLQDAVTGTTATAQTISTRIAAVRDLALTKFPFSIAAAIDLSVPSGASSYSFTSLTVAPGVVVPINPMDTPFGGFLTWARQMVVYMFWIGTILAILRKAMEI